MRLFGQDKPAAASPESEPAPKARVRIDGADYALAALDHERLVLADYDGGLIRHQRFYFAFLLPVDGEEVEAHTHGVVLDIGDGRLLARYYAPQPYYQRLMRKAVDSLPIVDPNGR